MDRKINEKELNKFCGLLVKLEPSEFVGVCTMLKVPIMKDEKTAHEGEKIIELLVTKYCELNRNQRRNLTAILEVATEKEKKKGKKNNGHAAKNK